MLRSYVIFDQDFAVFPEERLLLFFYASGDLIEFSDFYQLVLNVSTKIGSGGIEKYWS